MALDLRVEDIRLSFIWVETLTGLLASPGRDGASLSFVGSGAGYAAAFDTLLGGGALPEGLEPPWRNLKAQRFWRGYLSRDAGKPLTGARLRRNLVPFRLKLPHTLEAAWQPAAGQAPPQLTLEGFLYPFGIALVVTAQSQGSLTLDETVDLAHRIKRNGRYTISGPGLQKADLPLYAAADRLLAVLRRKALGPDASPGANFDQDPFSVVTILRASGRDAAAVPLAGGEVHRALNALSHWPPNYQQAKLASLEKARRVTDSAMASSCVLYTTRRGQAVWCPDRFGGAPGTQHSLSCYHRNLTLAALQVESLCGLTSAAAEVVRSQGAAGLPSAFRDCATFAAGILGTLYGGARGATYCSSSISRHIELNDRAGDIELVRRELLGDAKPLRSARAA